MTLPEAFIHCSFRLTSSSTMLITLHLLLISAFKSITCVTINTVLTEFPSEDALPAADTYLLLHQNQLTFIPEGGLCHMTALEDLRIVDNKLQTIGNLTCVAANLKILNLNNNEISTIPDDAIEGFTKLQQLSLRGNKLTVLPNLQPLAGTMIKLIIASNPLSGNFEQVAGLSALQVFELQGIGLTRFPVFPHLPEVTTLMFGSQGDNFQSESEKVLDLTSLPKLINLHLTASGLTAIPTLRSQAHMYKLSLNPISAVSQEALAHNGFNTLILTGTDLTSFPCVAASSLVSLVLDNTPMTELPCLSAKVFALSMSGSRVQRVLPRHAVAMKRISTLRLKNTPDLEELHDYMDLGHSNHLDILNSPALDLCRCEHAWLKIAKERGAVVLQDDAACAGGEMWAAINSSRLLEICDASAFQAQDASDSGTAWSVQRTDAASCHLPAHAYYPSVPRGTCARHCLALPGCTTYKFLGTMGRLGHCQVLVPTTPPAPVTVPDAGDAGWKCYTALPGNTQRIF